MSDSKNPTVNFIVTHDRADRVQVWIQTQDPQRLIESWFHDEVELYWTHVMGDKDTICFMIDRNQVSAVKYIFTKHGYRCRP